MGPDMDSTTFITNVNQIRLVLRIRVPFLRILEKLPDGLLIGEFRLPISTNANLPADS
jgi:hypothetical protein